MNDDHLKEIREQLAALCHDQWAGWMQYLLSKCNRDNTFVVTMPNYYEKRWARQMNTPYADLPEDEKESDRKEADRILLLLPQLSVARTEYDSSQATHESNTSTLTPDGAARPKIT